MKRIRNVHELINFLCMHATVDQIDFWGPKLVLAKTRQNENELLTDATLMIEGPVSIQTGGKVLTASANDEELKLSILTKLRRQEVIKFQLDEETNDLILEFKEDKKLIVHGLNGEYEAWQLDAYTYKDYIGVIATSSKKLTLFLPQNDTIDHTHGYLLFNMYSDEEIDVAQFAQCLPIDKKRSYSKGDHWQNNEEFRKRKWSSVQITTPYSKTYDVTEEVVSMIGILDEHKDEIIQLKEKYKMKLYIDLVLNIEEANMPYAELSDKNMELLSQLGAIFQIYVYDMTK